MSQKRKQRHADHATQQEQDDAQQEEMEKALALRATWLSANSWEAMLAMIEHMNIYTDMDEDGMDEESNPGWQLAAALMALQASDAAEREARVDQAEKLAGDSEGQLKLIETFSHFWLTHADSGGATNATSPELMKLTSMVWRWCHEGGVITDNDMLRSR